MAAYQTAQKFKLKDLLGESVLVQKDGKARLEKISILEGKTLGLYFSASWCPPCQRFTPEFAKVYEAVKKAGKSFEVVFISGDRTEEAFQEYFRSMPWLAAEREVWSQAADAFQVQGIPRLIILDAEGCIVNADAAQQVSRDLSGQEFPWPGGQSLRQAGSTRLAWQLAAVIVVYAIIRWYMGTQGTYSWGF